ncbi:unnamed protein product [Caenorhabditis sp. 36 PRJEB53466]|nr:unnamed protein product [Caenorhabditis sp. 36 PRJEB53466]
MDGHHFYGFDDFLRSPMADVGPPPPPPPPPQLSNGTQHLPPPPVHGTQHPGYYAPYAVPPYMGMNPNPTQYPGDVMHWNQPLHHTYNQSFLPPNNNFAAFPLPAQPPATQGPAPSAPAAVQGSAPSAEQGPAPQVAKAPAAPVASGPTLQEPAVVQQELTQEASGAPTTDKTAEVELEKVVQEPAVPSKPVQTKPVDEFEPSRESQRLLPVPMEHPKSENSAAPKTLDKLVEVSAPPAAPVVVAAVQQVQEVKDALPVEEVSDIKAVQGTQTDRPVQKVQADQPHQAVQPVLADQSNQSGQKVQIDQGNQPILNVQAVPIVQAVQKNSSSQTTVVDHGSRGIQTIQVDLADRCCQTIASEIMAESNESRINDLSFVRGPTANYFSEEVIPVNGPVRIGTLPGIFINKELSGSTDSSLPATSTTSGSSSRSLSEEQNETPSPHPKSAQQISDDEKQKRMIECWKNRKEDRMKKSRGTSEVSHSANNSPSSGSSVSARSSNSRSSVSPSATALQDKDVSDGESEVPRKKIRVGTSPVENLLVQQSEKMKTEQILPTALPIPLEPQAATIHSEKLGEPPIIEKKEEESTVPSRRSINDLVLNEFGFEDERLDSPSPLPPKQSSVVDDSQKSESASFNSSRNQSPVDDVNENASIDGTESEPMEVDKQPENRKPVDPNEMKRVISLPVSNRTKKRMGVWDRAQHIYRQKPHKSITKRELLKIKQAEKRAEQFREESSHWSFHKRLRYGLEQLKDTLTPEEIKKLEDYLEKHDPSKAIYLTTDINLDTIYPDQGNYRHCDKYLMDQVLGYVPRQPKRKGGRVPGIPKVPPRFSTLGKLHLPLDCMSKDVVQAAEQWKMHHINAVYKIDPLTPPTPDTSLVNLERELHKKLGNNHVMRFKNKNALRIPVSRLPVKTKEEVYDERFERILNSATITNVSGIGKALGMDYQKFSLQAIYDKLPDMKMDVLYQCPQTADTNKNMEGEQGWRTTGFIDKMPIEEYMKYATRVKQESLDFVKEMLESDDMETKQVEIRQRLLAEQVLPDSPDYDPRMYWNVFGTNIDMQDTKVFAEQFKEINKLPPFLRPMHEGNLLNMISEPVLGVNTVQVYSKPPGSRTPAHMENSLMSSININVGPGTCIWYSVPYEYWGKLRDLITQKRCSYHGQDYWPDEKELLKAGIPVTKFEQKQDEMVYVNTGTFHWVQSVGFCVNVSWNVGQPTPTQLATAMIAFSHNIEAQYFAHVPLCTLAWDMARKKKYLDDERMYKLVRTIMIRSLAYTKWYYDALREEDKETFAKWDATESVPRCKKCGIECYNITRWCAIMEEEEKTVTPYCPYCNPAPKERRQGFSDFHTFFYNWDELLKTFDEYRLPGVTV